LREREQRWGENISRVYKKGFVASNGGSDSGETVMWMRKSIIHRLLLLLRRRLNCDVYFLIFFISAAAAAAAASEEKGRSCRCPAHTRRSASLKHFSVGAAAASCVFISIIVRTCVCDGATLEKISQAIHTPCVPAPSHLLFYGARNYSPAFQKTHTLDLASSSSIPTPPPPTPHTPYVHEYTPVFSPAKQFIIARRDDG
jgi:hypothetical protein